MSKQEENNKANCPPLLRARNRELLHLRAKDGEDEWKGDFTFVQAADSQFGLIDRYILKNPPPWSWEEEKRLVKLTVEKVNKLVPKPKFMIICGDLVDAMPFEKNRKEQIDTFYDLFGKLCPSIPLVCVCGNHDVGDHPTVESIRSYTDNFGDDYFSFWVSGVHCIVLNSQLYKHWENCPDLKASQDKWLDDHLKSIQSAKNKPKHILVFQHIPWFIRDADEPEDNYFNIGEQLRGKMLSKLSEAGVSAVFCGHYHQNAGGRYVNKKNGKTLDVIVTSAIGAQLGKDKSGFRLVRVTSDAVSNEYVEIE